MWIRIPFLAVLSLLLLLAPASLGVNQTLHSYLERAESQGIIDGGQVQELLQLARSMDLENSVEMPSEVPTESAEPADKRTSMFMHVYSHLTLLNVLYICGAVIIMGAYSLFMTMAYEQCGYGTLSLIVLVQVAALGNLGVVMWHSVEFAYAGGM